MDRREVENNRIMCKGKLKKSVNMCIDNLLEKNDVHIDEDYSFTVSVKLFGNPVTDFDFKGMTRVEMSNIRKLISNKIDSYGR
jgi:hypothetical protein